RTFPNPGGRPVSTSRGFGGRGVANLVSAFFHCMRSAGSMSRPAYLVQPGAGPRWASVATGLTGRRLVPSVAGLAERGPLAALGALLIARGWSAIDGKAARRVWRVSWPERVVMVVSLVRTVALSPQVAILLGVLGSLAQFGWSSARVEV